MLCLPGTAVSGTSQADSGPLKERKKKGGRPEDELVAMKKALVRWIVAKVIEFCKREDWKPKRGAIREGQLAKVIMFPDRTTKKSA
jgi:hypothetical protein